MLAAVVVAGAILLGMVAAAGYAARTLPSGARVPLHAGMPEHSVWLAKPVGLAAWLGVGAAAFAALAALTLSRLAANWEQSTRFVLLPGVMLVVLAAEASAIIVARRCAARPNAASLVAESTESSAAESTDTPAAESADSPAVESTENPAAAPSPSDGAPTGSPGPATGSPGPATGSPGPATGSPDLAEAQP